MKKTILIFTTFIIFVANILAKASPIVDEYGNTRLIQAVDSNDFQLVKELLSQNYLLTEKNYFKKDAFYHLMTHYQDDRYLPMINYLTRLASKKIKKDGFNPKCRYAEFILEVNASLNKLNRVFYQDTPLIPKIIHQIWIGPKPLDSRLKAMTESWIQKHPKWKYKLWINSDLENFELENIRAFESSQNWGSKADIFRYEILKKYGGVYVDIDFECLKALDEIHHKCDFYCSRVSKNDLMIANGLIGCCPNHPIINSCIKKISELDNLKKQSNDDVFKQTGPHMFTAKVLEFFLDHNMSEEKLLIFPYIYYFPFPADKRSFFWNNQFTDKQIKKYLSPKSYAVHYWATSWQT